MYAIRSYYDPTGEGVNYSDEEFFQKITDSSSNKSRGKFYYYFQGKEKALYYEYIPSIESYVRNNFV